MSEALEPTQFTTFGTGEKMVMTLRSNMVRVSPPIRVLLLMLIRMKRAARTTMKISVGRRGMTSTGTAIYVSGLSRNYASWLLTVGRWLRCLNGQQPTANSFDRNLPQQIERRQHRPRSQRNARQRILGERDGQAGLLAQALVEVLQHRAAAGDNDSLVHDVR